MIYLSNSLLEFIILSLPLPHSLPLLVYYWGGTAANSWNAFSSPFFCSGVNMPMHACNISGLDSSCFTMPSMRVASGLVTGNRPRANTSEIIDRILGRFALFGPRIEGWLFWIRSHKYPYTCGASSSSSTTGSHENLRGEGREKTQTQLINLFSVIRLLRLLFSSIRSEKIKPNVHQGWMYKHISGVFFHHSELRTKLS